MQTPEATVSLQKGCVVHENVASSDARSAISTPSWALITGCVLLSGTTASTSRMVPLNRELGALNADAQELPPPSGCSCMGQMARLVSTHGVLSGHAIRSGHSYPVSQAIPIQSLYTVRPFLSSHSIRSGHSYPVTLYGQAIIFQSLYTARPFFYSHSIRSGHSYPVTLYGQAILFQSLHTMKPFLSSHTQSAVDDGPAMVVGTSHTRAGKTGAAGAHVAGLRLFCVKNVGGAVGGLRLAPHPTSDVGCSARARGI